MNCQQSVQPYKSNGAATPIILTMILNAGSGVKLCCTNGCSRTERPFANNRLFWYLGYDCRMLSFHRSPHFIRVRSEYFRMLKIAVITSWSKLREEDRVDAGKGVKGGHECCILLRNKSRHYSA